MKDRARYVKIVARYVIVKWSEDAQYYVGSAP